MQELCDSDSLSDGDDNYEDDDDKGDRNINVDDDADTNDDGGNNCGNGDNIYGSTKDNIMVLVMRQMMVVTMLVTVSRGVLTTPIL